MNKSELTEKTVILGEEFRKNGIEVDADRAELLVRYYELITERNKVMNLTRITEFRDVIYRHYMDSYACLPYLDEWKVKKVIDIGTGAGIPGIPIKIMRPDIEVLMVDSVGKKAAFVQDVINELALKSCNTIHARVEDLGRDKRYREKYDACVSRALAELRVLGEYSLPFVRTGGTFLTYKAYDVEAEIVASENAVSTLGGGEIISKPYEVDGIKRKIIIVKKAKKTPMQYPRKSGIPSKDPI